MHTRVRSSALWPGPPIRLIPAPTSAHTTERRRYSHSAPPRSCDEGRRDAATLSKPLAGPMVPAEKAPRMHAIRLLRLLALALSFILSSAILAAQAFGPAFLDGLVRSLNPLLVGRRERMLGVCYMAEDGPAADAPPNSPAALGFVMCGDLPTNRATFAGWWFLTPARHALEWAGFLAASVAVLAIAVRIWPCGGPPAPGDPRPRRWAAAATLSLYPYVAWCKLGWDASNYPGRWTLFVAMPQGLLWLVSAAYCLGFRHRTWLLQTWVSFLPTVLPLTKALAMEVARIVRDGQLLGGDDSSYQVAYLLHALYLLALPAFHVLRGELSMGSLTDVLRFQLVGTALAAFFYVVLVTPVAITYGISIFQTLVPGDPAAGGNYRLLGAFRWFACGSAIRAVLRTLERLRLRVLVGRGGAETEEEKEKRG